MTTPNVVSESIADELAQLLEELETDEIKNVTGTIACQDIQTSLDRITDELRVIVDEQYFVELHEICRSIRQIFNILCEKLTKAEAKIEELTKLEEQVKTMQKQLDKAEISDGHLCSVRSQRNC
ncbi:unnamed protein product [Didymodactylos carnosus]|uniref:Uncharacterized protein n=1 Tax=Didymodactylos carnosus TaxID=1234261 RepID=A0A814DLC8_9BILA|nr:unnamed protein product [Didymodactylos carnosus]CAF3730428.1 unnamed protein product [Didymodactylos carnosus]